MKNLPTITRELIKNRLGAMTMSEMESIVKLTIEFEKTSNHTIVEVMTIIQELNNEEIGISNKVLCAGMDANHWVMIAHLHNKGWLEDNEDGKNMLTEKGFREMNNADNVVTFNVDTDRLVLQNFDGSLYWNKKHENFDKIMDEIKKEIEEELQNGGYNYQLKKEMPPVSRNTLKLFRRMEKMSVYDKNGELVR